MMLTSTRATQGEAEQAVDPGPTAKRSPPSYRRASAHAEAGAAKASDGSLSTPLGKYFFERSISWL